MPETVEGPCAAETWRLKTKLPHWFSPVQIILEQLVVFPERCWTLALPCRIRGLERHHRGDVATRTWSCLKLDSSEAIWSIPEKYGFSTWNRHGGGMSLINWVCDVTVPYKFDPLVQTWTLVTQQGCVASVFLLIVTSNTNKCTEPRQKYTFYVARFPLHLLLDIHPSW